MHDYVAHKEGDAGNKHQGADQWLFVVSGTGRAIIGKKKYLLRAHTAPIPPGAIRGARVGAVRDVRVEVKIATFNVNGIERSWATVEQWFTREQPDVACLQANAAGTGEKIPMLVMMSENPRSPIRVWGTGITHYRNI